MNVITVEDFHKAYNGSVAVAGISFQVQNGEVLGLVGPNGAGKTTTLKALAAIISASRGRLQVAGVDVERHPLVAKGHAAYVSDDPQLFGDLSVVQHLAFFASVYGVTSAQPKAEQLLQRFDLANKQHVPASELSRGMRQKLAICCAYLHDPSAILFDEPLTGLDPRAIRTLKDSIVERAESGAATIISSHLLAMVEDICTHVLILDQGQQRFCGPIGELRSRFACEEQDASLEDIFFRATEDTTPAAVSTL
jgi:ABC-2 type transport system ATP-binding protein